MLEFNEIANTIKSVAENYELTKVWIFGSYAKKEPTPDSDIDILLQTEDVAEGFKIVDVKFALEEALNKKVDIVTTGGLKGSLLEDANLGEILIYQK